MKQPIKMTPGDDLHLTMLMAPHSLNLAVDQFREQLLGYGRAAFEAGKARQCLHQIQEPAVNQQLTAVPVAAMTNALREAEAALEVSLARILKANPGHSVSVTSEAKALVAVRQALSAQAAPVAAPTTAKFFSFDPAEDLELHDTQEQAQAKAQSCIDLYREEGDGWAVDEVGRVCWGVVIEQATEVSVAGHDSAVDFVLQGAAPVAVGEREAFESFRLSRITAPHAPVEHIFARDESGEYLDRFTASSWKFWQGSRAALAAKPAAGFDAGNTGNKTPVPKWIDDPHDIEQGQMLNPEWVKLQETTKPEDHSEQTLNMVNMTPPATSRDRWMYEQGRLAERDARTHGNVAAAAPVVLPEPVLYVSGGQLEEHCDPEDASGNYIPARKTAAGLFTTPLYTGESLLAGVSAPAAQQKVGSYVTTSGELKPDVLVYSSQADARDAAPAADEKDPQWPKHGDLVRYADGSTTLALHGKPHASGWHGVQCMGGYTFYTEVRQPSETDRAKWVECAIRYRGRTIEEARAEAGLSPAPAQAAQQGGEA